MNLPFQTKFSIRHWEGPYCLNHTCSSQDRNDGTIIILKRALFFSVSPVPVFSDHTDGLASIEHASFSMLSSSCPVPSFSILFSDWKTGLKAPPKDNRPQTEVSARIPLEIYDMSALDGFVSFVLE